MEKTSKFKQTENKRIPVLGTLFDVLLRAERDRDYIKSQHMADKSPLKGA